MADVSFSLDSDVGGEDAVQVALQPPDDCATTGATEVPSDEVGMRRFERIDSLPPQLRSVRTYVFEGGCVTYRSPSTPSAARRSSSTPMLRWPCSPETRSSRRSATRAASGSCGFGAPACPGGE